jgi:hypothetical protein
LCSSNITTDINDWLSFWTIDWKNEFLPKTWVAVCAK